MCRAGGKDTHFSGGFNASARYWAQEVLGRANESVYLQRERSTTFFATFRNTSCAPVRKWLEWKE